MSAAAVPFASSVASTVFATSAQIVDRETKVVYSKVRKLLIGLLSDTHIALPSETLPPQIRDAFRDVDLILHAGDIWIPSVLDELESIAPVMAAWGDDDLETDLSGDKRMVDERSLHFNGVTLWLMHDKPPYGHIRPKEALYYLRPSSQESDDPPDVVVFGHTHRPIIEHYKDALLVSPGSATLPNYEPRLGTVARLTINSGEIEVHIVQLE
ncbi:YfcE family phosphodiesterase [Chloroflexota bacterium]